MFRKDHYSIFLAKHLISNRQANNSHSIMKKEEVHAQSIKLMNINYCRLTGHNKKRALSALKTFVEQGVLIRYGTGKQVVYAKVM